MVPSDWVAWHEPYDDPMSWHRQRLVIVQAELERALDVVNTSPMIASMCAGDGRDVIEVLASRKGATQPRAVLVELDPTLSGRAREAARRASLKNVKVITGDAALVETYGEIFPVDVLLLCGVFGNIPDSDIRRTVAALPALCRTGGRVIWTRHRQEPDLTPSIRSWFEQNAFEELAWHAPADLIVGVGVHQYVGPAAALPSAAPLFTFG